eukprot:1158863-Pelagomonas_calceolata.AAC.5
MTITLEVDSGTLPPADDIIPPESDDRIPDLGIGGRRSLKVEIPDLGIDLSDVKDQINQALMPALETALNRSTSNLGNPLQDIEITVSVKCRQMEDKGKRISPLLDIKSEEDWVAKGSKTRCVRTKAEKIWKIWMIACRSWDARLRDLHTKPSFCKHCKQQKTNGKASPSCYDFGGVVPRNTAGSSYNTAFRHTSVALWLPSDFNLESGEMYSAEADYNFEPGEMYSAEVHVTIPSAFLIRDKLDAFMVGTQACSTPGRHINEHSSKTCMEFQRLPESEANLQYDVDSRKFSNQAPLHKLFLTAHSTLHLNTDSRRQCDRNVQYVKVHVQKQAEQNDQDLPSLLTACLHLVLQPPISLGYP